MATKTKKAKAKKAKTKTKGAQTKRRDYSAVRIKFLERDNPRREGTNAGKRHQAARTYNSEHRTATAKDILKNTKPRYTAADLSYDLKHNFIELVPVAAA